MSYRFHYFLSFINSYKLNYHDSYQYNVKNYESYDKYYLYKVRGDDDGDCDDNARNSRFVLRPNKNY